MASVFNLSSILKLDSNTFNTGLDKASRRFNKFSGDQNRGLDRVNQGFGRMSLGGIAALTALGAAAYKTVQAFAESEAAVAQLEASLKSTGGVAGFTSKQLQDHAAALQEVTAYDDDAIISAQSLLLTFTKIREALPETTELMLDLAAKMGTKDLKGAAIQLGKALNDPVKGVSALTDAGVSFTAQQKTQIAAMVKANNILGAQKIILQELRIQFGGSAAAAAKTFNGRLAQLKNTIGNLAETIGGLFTPTLQRMVQRLKDATKAIDNFVKTNRTIGSVLNSNITEFIIWTAAIGIAGNAFTFLKNGITPVFSLLTKFSKWASLGTLKYGTQALKAGTLEYKKQSSQINKLITKVKEYAGMLRLLGGDVENQNRVADRYNRVLKRTSPLMQRLLKITKKYDKEGKLVSITINKMPRLLIAMGKAAGAAWGVMKVGAASASDAVNKFLLSFGGILIVLTLVATAIAVVLQATGLYKNKLGEAVTTNEWFVGMMDAIWIGFIKIIQWVAVSSVKAWEWMKVGMLNSIDGLLATAYKFQAAIINIFSDIADAINVFGMLDGVIKKLDDFSASATKKSVEVTVGMTTRRNESQEKVANYEKQSQEYIANYGQAQADMREERLIKKDAKALAARQPEIDEQRKEQAEEKAAAEQELVAETKKNNELIAELTRTLKTGGVRSQALGIY